MPHIFHQLIAYRFMSREHHSLDESSPTWSWRRFTFGTLIHFWFELRNRTLTLEPGADGIFVTRRNAFRSGIVLRIDAPELSFFGVGVHCAKSRAPGDSLWLPPHDMPCLVFNSGFWSRGSLCDEQNHDAAAAIRAPCTVAMQCVPSVPPGQIWIHYWIDGVYVASLESSAVSTALKWRYAVCGTAGRVEILCQPVPLLPDELQWVRS